MSDTKELPKSGHGESVPKLPDDVLREAYWFIEIEHVARRYGCPFLHAESLIQCALDLKEGKLEDAPRAVRNRAYAMWAFLCVDLPSLIREKAGFNPFWDSEIRDVAKQILEWRKRTSRLSKSCVEGKADD